MKWPKQIKGNDKNRLICNDHKQTNTDKRGGGCAHIQADVPDY